MSVFLLSRLAIGIVCERLRMLGCSPVVCVEKSGLVCLRMAPDRFNPVGGGLGAENRRVWDGSLCIKVWQVSHVGVVRGG